jgi:hypothetical protein
MMYSQEKKADISPKVLWLVVILIVDGERRGKTLAAANLLWLKISLVPKVAKTNYGAAAFQAWALCNFNIHPVARLQSPIFFICICW